MYHYESAPLRQKNVRGLTLQQHTSSTSNDSSPALRQNGFTKSSKSLRRTDGAKALPPYPASPFRILTENEDSPLTPIDVSPITPRTPKFAQAPQAPSLALSPPLSPHSTRAAISDLDSEISRRRIKEAELKRQLKGGSNSGPDPHGFEAGQSTSILTYEVPHDDEEYVQYIKSEYARLANRKAITPSPQPSIKDQTHHLPRKSSRVHLTKEATRPRPTETLSVSTTGHHRKLSADRVPQRSLSEDPSSRNDSKVHIRNASSASKSSGRGQYHDFAAAKEALERERAGLHSLDCTIVGTTTTTKSNTTSPLSIEGPYPMPQSLTAQASEPLPVSQPRITPTPVKPLLSRVGSKLKSEVKGAFTRRAEQVDGHGKRYEEESPQRLETLHWTELE